MNVLNKVRRNVKTVILNKPAAIGMLMLVWNGLRAKVASRIAPAVLENVKIMKNQFGNAPAAVFAITIVFQIHPAKLPEIVLTIVLPQAKANALIAPVLRPAAIMIQMFV